MSLVAEAPVRTRPATRHVDGDPHKYGAALRALSEIATASVETVDVDELLRLVARRACEVLGIARCAVYLRDDPRDVFVGRAAHPREETEAAVRRLTVGGPTDAITQEILRTRAPVLIRDTRADPRAAQASVRTWRVRSLLGVPMLAGQEIVGLLFFDNARDAHPYSPADVEIASTVARLLAGAVAQDKAVAQLRAQAELAVRQNRLLRNTAAAEHRLSQTLLEGGGLPAVVALVAELTGKPTTLYDAQRQPVAAASRATGDGSLQVRLLEDTADEAGLVRLVRDAAPGSCTSVEPLLSSGVRHRHLVAPVDVRGDRWGWLVVMEHPSRISAFDEFLTRRAATHLALEVGAQRRAATAAWDARAWLARQLVRGTQDAEDVRRNAEYLGIALEVPRVVAYVTRTGTGTETGTDTGTDTGEATPLDAQELVDRLRRHLGAEVLATKGPEGVALLIDVPAGPALPAVRRVKLALEEVCAGLAGAPVAGISSVCRSPAALPRAYREARDVTRCIERFASVALHHVLAADDLGPGRLFVANADAAAIGRFVDDVIGPLLEGDDGTRSLVRTLQSFYDTGRSVRLSSIQLGVHENTVRYRLARVHALTGLDVAGDASDQLSVQMALLVLRLQGHPDLPPFDAELEFAADDPAPR
jgi:sugar diacid utilization regulator